MNLSDGERGAEICNEFLRWVRRSWDQLEKCTATHGARGAVPPQGGHCKEKCQQGVNLLKP